MVLQMDDEVSQKYADLESIGYKPRNGVAVLYGRSVLKTLPTAAHSGCTKYVPNNTGQ